MNRRSFMGRLFGAAAVVPATGAVLSAYNEETGKYEPVPGVDALGVNGPEQARVDLDLKPGVYGSKIKINGKEVPKVRRVEVVAEAGQDTPVTVKLEVIPDVIHVTGDLPVEKQDYTPIGEQFELDPRVRDAQRHIEVQVALNDAVFRRQLDLLQKHTEEMTKKMEASLLRCSKGKV